MCYQDIYVTCSSLALPAIADITTYEAHFAVVNVVITLAITSKNNFTTELDDCMIVIHSLKAYRFSVSSKSRYMFSTELYCSKGKEG